MSDGASAGSHPLCPADSASARSSSDNGLACKLRFVVPNTTATSQPLLAAAPNNHMLPRIGWASVDLRYALDRTAPGGEIPEEAEPQRLSVWDHPANECDGEGRGKSV